MSKEKITGRCFLVTGATSGIGKAITLQLAQDGNFVIASGRNRDALLELIGRVKGKVSAFPMDLASDDDEMPAYSTQLRELTDYLDGVICCAGVCEYDDTLAFNPALYRRVFETNVLGVVKTLNLALPLLKQSEKRAKIVVVGSLSSLVPFPRAEAYGASKAAIDYMTQALYVESRHWPVDVTLVRPGFVKTPMTQTNDFQMPFAMEPDQAASRIIHGMSKGEKLIHFPRRLYWPILWLSWVKWFWLEAIGPRMSRQTKQSWY